MGVHHGPENAIRQVVQSKSWIRRELTAHGVHPDPAEWQGMPGVQVAAQLIGIIETLPVPEDPVAAQQRAKSIAQCSQGLGIAVQAEVTSAVEGQV